MPAYGIDRRFEEVGVYHAGDLNRILESQKKALPRSLFRLHRRQIAALVEDAPARDDVSLTARQRVGKRTLARPVRAHYGMHLSWWDPQIEPSQDFLAVNIDVQVFDPQHDPSFPIFTS